MIALRLFVLLSLLTGVLYPLALLCLGSLVTLDHTLIGQSFTNERNFWPRPSSIAYDPLKSGGSQLSPTSPALQEAVKARRAFLVEAHPQRGEPPPDLLFSSGSGLDPHISLKAALFQAERVAKARQRSVVDIQSLIEQSAEGWNKPRVNVLKLNLLLEGSHHE